jgi:hypothetical protein
MPSHFLLERKICVSPRYTEDEFKINESIKKASFKAHKEIDDIVKKLLFEEIIDLESKEFESMLFQTDPE